MATITFDTHKFIRKLRDAGLAEQQAEAFAEAFQEAQAEAELATKNDIQRLEIKFDGEMRLIRWMLGILIAGVLSLVLKTFF